MKKRGAVYDTIFLYILASLVIVSIFVFGYNSFTGLRERQCEQDIIILEETLRDKISEMDNAKLTFRKERLSIGCGVEKVYFIDRREKVDSFFDGEAIVNRSISDDAKDNIFLMRSTSGDPSEGKDAFGISIDRMDIPFPYFTCTLVKDGHIDVIIESTSYGTSVTNYDYELDCGFWKYMGDIVREVWPDEDNEKMTRLLVREIQDNLGKIDDTREFISVPGSDSTEVIVTLKAKEDIESLHHFEIISKCLAGHVDDLLFVLPPDAIVNEDPLLMWEFEDVSKEEEIVIRYTVEKEIDELCKNFVKSLSETIISEKPDFNQLYISQELDVASIIDQEAEEKNGEFIEDISDINDEIADLPDTSTISVTSPYYKRIVWLEYKIDILEQKIHDWERSLEIFKDTHYVDTAMGDRWEDMIESKIAYLENAKKKLIEYKKELLELDDDD